MDKTAVTQFICKTVREISESTGAENTSEITEETLLLGSDGVLSSLMLVELMLALEDYCTDHGCKFVWTDDSAMSDRRSMYRSVSSLVDFVMGLPSSSAQ